MTVHSIGFGWWQRLVDRCDWRIFRRVNKVSLDGPKYTSDLLPHLGNLRHLQELNLADTSVSESDLEVWKEQHPHVVVRISQRVLAR